MHATHKERLTLKISTQKWNKIWFSTNPDKFVADKYKKNFDIAARFARENPQTQQTVFFSSAILNENGMRDFEALKATTSCFANHITKEDMKEITSLVEMDGPSHSATLM